MINLLYDGWPLLHTPNSPEALHLLRLLEQRHAQVQAAVALPGQPPPWLPEAIASHVLPVADTPRARLAWEQRSLPRLVRELGADLLHLTTLHPPLLGMVPCVVSPAEYPSTQPPAGFIPRVREALASGGLSRLHGLLWPSDLRAVSPPETTAQVYHLPIEPLPDTSKIPEHDIPMLEALHLPDTYILYDGPGDSQSLRRLLEAWSWAAGSIGEYYPLLILGLDPTARQRLQALLAETDFQETVLPLPVVDPAVIPHLYQACSVVFHPAPLSAWSAAGWLSLTFGKPLVAADSSLADALAGPAAYLLPEQDTRGLGAGLITVIVEEQVANGLSQAGKQRAATWDQRSFRDALFAAYQAILAAG